MVNNAVSPVGSPVLQETSNPNPKKNNDLVELPSEYQKFIHLSRYARYKDDLGRRETWGESVRRYFDFFDAHINSHSPKAIKEYRAIREELEHAVLNLEVMPSMRALMTAGKALERDHVAGYNCSFIPCDSPRAFDEAMYILMCGTGVGFSVENFHISKLPIISEEFQETDTTIMVPDSKMGWAVSFRELIAMLYAGRIPKWDLRRLRPAGSRLKTMGGRSSGPEPLNALFGFACATFKNAAGRKLTSLECHDLMCKIADVIVVGGVRRCLPADSFILSKHGIRKIKDIKIGEKLIGHDGKYGTVVAKENTGVRDTVTIKTQVGDIECTPEHRMAILSSLEGDYIWKEAKDIICGEDFLLFETTPIKGKKTRLPEFSYKKPKHSTTCKDIVIPELDEDMAWFFGNLHGDGYIYNPFGGKRGVKSHGYVSIACADSFPEQHSRVVQQLKRFGVRVSEKFGTIEKCSKPAASSRQLALYLSQFKTAKKPIEVPEFILEGLPQIRSAYLAGVFDADGSIGNRPILLCASVYYGFLLQQQALYASLGIPTYIKKNRDSIGKWKALYHLVIKGENNLRVFEQTIGKYSIRVKQCGITHRKKEQSGFITPKSLFLKSLGVSKFRHFSTYKTSDVQLSWKKFCDETKSRTFIPIKILSIDGGSKKECYDIQVDGTEEFCVNGILTHNSALISLSDLNDQQMRNAKSGKWWEISPQRALANNSASYNGKPDMETFMREWLALVESKSGERGIFNLEAARKHASSNGRRDGKQIAGGNPCMEILLRSNEFCNLSEVVVRGDDTVKSLKEKIRFATILGTLQATLTDFRYLRKVWKTNAEEEALLGVSMTGIMDNAMLATNNEKLPAILQDLKSVAIETNKEWAKILGIKQSAGISCVKPAGTTSQLTDSASGIHARHSRFYIRTVRADKKDPLARMMVQAGFPVEDDVTKPDSVYVFSFPIESPPNAVLRNELTAIQQLEIWKTYALNWCEHKPSVTISVKESEWLEVGAWVYKNFDTMSGVSFLPYADHIYKQAPYQEITEAQYKELAAKMPKADWGKLIEFEHEDNTTGTQTLSCTGGSCEIVDLTS